MGASRTLLRKQANNSQNRLKAEVVALLKANPEAVSEALEQGVLTDADRAIIAELLAEHDGGDQ